MYSLAYLLKTCGFMPLHLFSDDEERNNYVIDCFAAIVKDFR